MLPRGPGRTPVARTGRGARGAVEHVEPGSAGPVGMRPGGDFLPGLLSSEFQRSHRTPAQLAGGCCPGWVTWGGVSPGAVPQGR